MLDINEILELEDDVRNELSNRLEEILVKLNRTGKLHEFLELTGMQHLLDTSIVSETARNGVIIVIGQSEVEREKLLAVAKSMGIGKERFEFYLDYESAKTFDFRKTQWSVRYSYILVGQMPHSGINKGDYGSIISALENEDGYPPVLRVGTQGLKITKTAFRSSLEYLIDNKLIAA